MILVDTNLVLRMSRTDDPDFGIAADAVDIARQQGYAPCLVPQVIYEYWAVATRPRENNGLGLTAGQANTEVGRMLQQFDLLRDPPELYDEWLILVHQHEVQGKPAHDARLVAAMLTHSITHLLTFNTPDSQRFIEITAIHPGDAGQLGP
jgi:predicted nucleic acid-binding protein